MINPFTVGGAVIVLILAGAMFEGAARDRNARRRASLAFMTSDERRQWLKERIREILSEHQAHMTPEQVAAALIRFALSRGVDLPEILPEQILVVLEDLAAVGHVWRDSFGDQTRYHIERRRSDCERRSGRIERRVATATTD